MSLLLNKIKQFLTKKPFCTNYLIYRYETVEENCEGMTILVKLFFVNIEISMQERYHSGFPLPFPWWLLLS